MRRSGLFPANNMGDAAILYCFVFLYLSAAGPGPWSVDAMRSRGRAPQHGRLARDRNPRFPRAFPAIWLAIEADAFASAHGDQRRIAAQPGLSNCVFWGGCGFVPAQAAIFHRKVFLMATKALSFDVGDYVVYPKHGVGRVIELQSTDIAGMQLELYVLRFEKEKMTLSVPTNKAESVGMRKLSSDKTMQEALTTLKGKPRVKRTMWSRRAQEYEAKINSGDLVSIAEVVRDLFRARRRARAELFRAADFRGRLHPPRPRARRDGADRRESGAREIARDPQQGGGAPPEGARSRPETAGHSQP